ncbi:type II secretion system minor pseudopilin GspH [Vibrio anguillarum]|uniref:type II secretion system minor pseudopilin GspH n=1 Tax=Vibrio anguillarum TaxID=55601 RepID=UPI00097E31CE|nr:type II secretion system minor pseudopilin GspH [Vibrio anguillarum]MBF4284531.1 type II secretion system protein GspH [Vibrio anguillarum]MBF4287312.1 type II secretion system protein GspH [Vibrio anguillarum]MBF4341986.1 type II secretion system protein GspH [Vibrio anguillarum]MBF4356383.1 type II secretion system protein GspH [Vibrio anguillarum]MBF4379911.1 type II secretion system protein GspH [Vibrio anguillarum]
MLSQRGFTLLEILLVLVLLSLSAVAVISTLPSTNNDDAKQYAMSLYQRLQLSNEEAILSGKDFGLRVDEKKSHLVFLSMEDKGWQPLESKTMASQLQLPEGLSLQFELGGSAWKNDDRLFKPGSLFDDDKFADEGEQKKQLPPQVFILSSGELTPFVLSIHLNQQDAEQGWRVVVKENGEITLFAPGDAIDG